jgi:hypothetical protein
MSITICPATLVFNDETDITVINNYIGKYIIPLANKIREGNIDIEYSTSILSNLINIYPWGFQTKYATDWWNAIIQPILDHGVEIDFVDDIGISTTETLNDYFSQWLKCWALHDRVFRNKYYKGIFSIHGCNDTNRKSTCNQFIYIDNTELKLKYAQYPWLRRYNENLPVDDGTCDGDNYRFFTPPSDWITRSTIKGRKNGYLDIDGNEWKHHVAEKHWDVFLVSDQVYYHRHEYNGKNLRKKHRKD